MNTQELYLVNLNKKYVIGTHVMWFEIEMYADFIDGMANLLETVENKENVTIDLCFNMLQHFEKVDEDKIKKHELYIKFKKGVATLEQMGFWVNYEVKDKEDEFYFHTDYRRDLNYNYCKKVDYVMWGETDSFFPREAFQVIEVLSNYTDSQEIHRYLLSFADRKMWDSSWDPLVHVDYRNIEFVDDDKGHLNPNQAKSPMSIKKMNEILEGEDRQMQLHTNMLPVKSHIKTMSRLSIGATDAGTYTGDVVWLGMHDRRGGEDDADRQMIKVYML